MVKFFFSLKFFTLLDIENIYMEQKVDTNQNSEWGPDDDIESGLNVNKKFFLFFF